MIAPITITIAMRSTCGSRPRRCEIQFERDTASKASKLTIGGYALAPMATREAKDVELEGFSAAWETFFRAMRRARLRIPDEGASGLTLAQYLLLEPLAHGSPRSVRELADGAGVAPPTASRLLDGLERTGLAERRPSERDRRSVEVTLTADGEEALAATREWVQDRRRRLYEALSPAERAQTMELLGRLGEVVEELDADAS